MYYILGRDIGESWRSVKQILSFRRIWWDVALMCA